MSDIINQNTEPLFIFDMPDDETLSETISVKGEKGDRGDPTKLSDLTNDTGFITKDVQNLTNYYTKTATDNLLNAKADASALEAKADIDDIPTKLSELENDPNYISDDTTTITATGNSVKLAGTTKAPIIFNKLKGDTEQNSGRVVTGDNKIVVSTKNLFVAPSSGDIKGVKFTLNDDGTFNISGTATAQANDSVFITDLGIFEDGATYTLSATKPLVNVNVYLEVYNGTGTWVRHALGNYLNASRQSITSAIDLSDGDRLRLTLRVQNGNSVNMSGLGIQLEKNATATSFAKHQSKTYNLSLGDLELCKVTTYRDYIFKGGNTWYKHKEVEKIASYNGETIATDYISTTGDLSTGAVVHYGVDATVEEITDATLLGQLDTLWRANGYDGDTVIIATADASNLPLILDVSQHPSHMPIATMSELGNIIVGKGLSVDDGGVVSTINSTVTMYFPEIANLSGDMSILTFDDGETKKNAIIDFYNYNSTVYETTVQKILARGVSKIDYAFISHYHGDHIGFLTHMLSDSRFDFSECVFYLPITPDWDSFVGGVGSVPTFESTITSAIEAKGLKIIKPTNDMVLKINDDTSISFLNSDADDFATYYDIVGGVSWSDVPVTVYNNFSMVVQVNHGNQRLLFTGDIEAEAQRIIIEQGLQAPNFIKVEHHGRNGLYGNDGSTGHNLDFVRKYWRPAIAVGMGDHTTNAGLKLLQWQASIYEVYYTSISGDVTVTSDGQSVLAKSERGVYRPDGTILGDVLDMLGLGQSFKPTILADNTDLNDITTTGDYMSTSYVHTGTMTNIPNDGINHMFNLRVRQFGTGTSGYCEQTFVPASSPKFYIRFKTSTGWSTWVKFTGTSVPDQTES